MRVHRFHFAEVYNRFAVLRPAGHIVILSFIKHVIEAVGRSGMCIQTLRESIQHVAVGTRFMTR